MSCDVFFYVQHLLGIGHLQRAVTLAEGMAEEGFEVDLVAGGRFAPPLRLEKSRLTQLPPCHVTDEAFELRDEAGQPLTEAWKARRREALFSAFQDARPRCLMIELFPFGRRQMRFELLPLLEAATRLRPRPWIVTSQRDILNRQTKAKKIAWMLETFRRFFDLAIVHGDPKFLPFEESFPEAAQIAHALRYSGYVVRPQPSRTIASDSGEILVSAGGGAVGGPLVEATLAARPLTRFAKETWRILLGPNVAESTFQALRARAPSGVVLERARADFPQLLANCRLSVSQGGYNTVLEILACRAPAVVVPYAAGSETEQSLRCGILARRGLLEVLNEEDLTPASLAAAIDRTGCRGRAAGGADRAPLINLDLDGARNTATILKGLMEKRPDGALA